jgi:DNA-binding FrmR family transcriptional regulator
MTSTQLHAIHDALATVAIRIAEEHAAQARTIPGGHDHRFATTELAHYLALAQRLRARLQAE